MGDQAVGGGGPGSPNQFRISVPGVPVPGDFFFFDTEDAEGIF